MRVVIQLALASQVSMEAPPADVPNALPRAVYGHTLTSIGGGRLLRYGGWFYYYFGVELEGNFHHLAGSGCMFGGYSGIVADAFVLQTRVAEDGTSLACYAYPAPLRTNDPNAFGRMLHGPRKYNLERFVLSLLFRSIQLPLGNSTSGSPVKGMQAEERRGWGGGGVVLRILMYSHLPPSDSLCGRFGSGWIAVQCGTVGYGDLAVGAAGRYQSRQYARGPVGLRNWRQSMHSFCLNAQTTRTLFRFGFASGVVDGQLWIVGGSSGIESATTMLIRRLMLLSPIRHIHPPLGPGST